MYRCTYVPVDASSQLMSVMLLTRLPPAFLIIKLTSETINYLLALFLAIARKMEIKLIQIKVKERGQLTRASGFANNYISLLPKSHLAT